MFFSTFSSIAALLSFLKIENHNTYYKNKFYNIKNNQYQISNNHYRKDKTVIDQRESGEERQGPWTILAT